MQELQIIPAGEQTATFTSKEFEIAKGSKGAKFFLNISAVSGTTPTCIVKIQEKNPISGSWIDVQGALFASKTGVGVDTLEVYPGVVAVANRRVSGVLSKTVRAAALIGGTTPSFNMSLAAVLLD